MPMASAVRFRASRRWRRERGGDGLRRLVADREHVEIVFRRLDVEIGERYACAAVALLLVESLVQLVGPLLTRHVIDVAVPARDGGLVARVLALGQEEDLGASLGKRRRDFHFNFRQSSSVRTLGSRSGIRRTARGYSQCPRPERHP